MTIINRLRDCRFLSIRNQRTLQYEAANEIQRLSEREVELHGQLQRMIDRWEDLKLKCAELAGQLEAKTSLLEEERKMGTRYLVKMNNAEVYLEQAVQHIQNLTSDGHGFESEGMARQSALEFIVEVGARA